MRVALMIVVIACLCSGCGSTQPNAHPPTPVAGGCGKTALFRGHPPSWTAPAFADSTPGPTPWPYAISERGTVAAVVFGYPLRAGNPTGRMNKVLWIMKLPRHGSPLRIEGRPVDERWPVVRSLFPADSSPGEIYPSLVNVPKAGCWRLTLHWAGHVDSIDLRYHA